MGSRILENLIPGSRAFGIAVLAAVAGASSPAAARLTHRLALAVGGELRLRPELGGHGFGLAQYDLGGLPKGSHLVVSFNSETLRISFERIRFADGRAEAGFDVKGEALLAGLLTDYYRNGIADPARGFYASYFSTGAYIKRTAEPHYLELALGARRWFFKRQGVTSPRLVLPPDAWVGELRARYTLWLLEPDPSLYEAQRLFPRLRGFAFGVEAGLDVRSEARSWGARDTLAFAPADLRNDPGVASGFVRQWLYAGVAVHSRVRLQLAEVALAMWGEDDLVRARVGGMNPYVVPLAGVPWAAFLAGRLAAVEGSVNVRVWRELEVGVLADAVVLDDFDRTGVRTSPAVLFGAGAFADFRYRAWQFDARAGWSPTLRSDDRAALSVFGSAGWAWAR